MKGKRTVSEDAPTADRIEPAKQLAQQRLEIQTPYWTGGRFTSQLTYPTAAGADAAQLALGEIKAFVAECQKRYIAFNRGTSGRHRQHDLYNQMFKPEFGDRAFFVGTAPPEATPTPGSSTIAQMRQRELLACTVPNGEFDQEHAKALIVLIYQRWEGFFRPRLASALSVPISDLRSLLMGDIRLVRHAIIHKDSVVTKAAIAKMGVLPKIWSLQPGAVNFTEPMLHSMMEQLNALRVQAVPT